MDGLPGFCPSTRVKAAFSQRAFCGVVAIGCLIVGMSAVSGRDGSMAPQMSHLAIDAQARSPQSDDAESHVAGDPGHTLCTRGVYQYVAVQTGGIEHLEDLLGCGLPPDQARIPESRIDDELVDDKVAHSEVSHSEVTNNLYELVSWHRQWGTIPGETSALAGAGITGGLASKRE